MLEKRVVDGFQVAREGLLGQVFLPVTLGALSGLPKTELHQVAIFGVIGQDKDCGWHVNGWPMFASCRVWHVDDWRAAVAAYEKALRTQEDALGAAVDAE
jgi:hypothetical protein